MIILTNVSVGNTMRLKFNIELKDLIDNMKQKSTMEWHTGALEEDGQDHLKIKVYG